MHLTSAANIELHAPSLSCTSHFRPLTVSDEFRCIVFVLFVWVLTCICRLPALTSQHKTNKQVHQRVFGYRHAIVNSFSSSAAQRKRQACSNKGSCRTLLYMHVHACALTRTHAAQHCTVGHVTQFCAEKKMSSAPLEGLEGGYGLLAVADRPCMLN